jgi:4-hydroxy-tetrahydrodipicolinate synthase
MKIEMKSGFYPALGTPTDANGKLVTKSFEKQVEFMIDAGASGLLCMGSMGKMASIENREYPNVAKVCCQTVAHKVPLLVGVMDCSVSRVLERIEAIQGLDIDGVVATPPFYYKVNQEGIIRFFTLLSEHSGYPVYMYDLPSVTQSPVTPAIMKALINLPNIKGLKTANLNLILDLKRNDAVRNDFLLFYSGLDLFDVALFAGIDKNLDGMFTCAPVNSGRMYHEADYSISGITSECLNNILLLRNVFLKENVFTAYSYAMELIGCPGNYHPEYEKPISVTLKEEIYSCMKSIKEI